MAYPVALRGIAASGLSLTDHVLLDIIIKEAHVSLWKVNSGASTLRAELVCHKCTWLVKNPALVAW